MDIHFKFLIETVEERKRRLLDLLWYMILLFAVHCVRLEASYCSLIYNAMLKILEYTMEEFSIQRFIFTYS